MCGKGGGGGRGETERTTEKGVREWVRVALGVGVGEQLISCEKFARSYSSCFFIHGFLVTWYF